MITNFKTHKNAEKNAILVLKDHPKLQLEFLEKFLEERNIEKKIDDELLVLHIELLCKLNPSKVHKYMIFFLIKIKQIYRYFLILFFIETNDRF